MCSFEETIPTLLLTFHLCNFSSGSSSSRTISCVDFIFHIYCSNIGRMLIIIVERRHYYIVPDEFFSRNFL